MEDEEDEEEKEEKEEKEAKEEKETEEEELIGIEVLPVTHGSNAEPSSGHCCP